MGVCVISSIKYSIFANLCQNRHIPVVSTSSLAADSTTEPLYAAHVVPFNTYLLTDCARTLTLALLTHRWCRRAVWRLTRPQSRCTQRTSYRSTDTETAQHSTTNYTVTQKTGTNALLCASFYCLRQTVVIFSHTLRKVFSPFSFHMR